MSKNEIIDLLKFTKENEPFCTEDFIGNIDPSLVKKLTDSGYLAAIDATTNDSKRPEFMNVSIPIEGILFLTDLESEKYKKTLRAKVLPKLERLAWLVAGGLITIFIKIKTG
jgi:hypothetical protein